MATNNKKQFPLFKAQCRKSHGLEFQSKRSNGNAQAILEGTTQSFPTIYSSDSNAKWNKILLFCAATYCKFSNLTFSLLVGVK